MSVYNLITNTIQLFGERHVLYINLIPVWFGLSILIFCSKQVMSVTCYRKKLVKNIILHYNTIKKIYT